MEDCQFINRILSAGSLMKINHDAVDLGCSDGHQLSNSHGFIYLSKH